MRTDLVIIFYTACLKLYLFNLSSVMAYLDEDEYK